MSARAERQSYHGLNEPGRTPATFPSFAICFQARRPLTEPLPRAWAINVSFADGHAEWVKLPDLWALMWNRTWDPGARPPDWP